MAKQRIDMFASNYDSYNNKFGYWAYANRIEENIKKQIKGKRFKVVFSSYPFYFNHKTNTIETAINIGIETTAGAIAKKIMRMIAMWYNVNEGKMKGDKSIECLHSFDTLSIEGFDIDTDNCVIDNIYIGS